MGGAHCVPQIRSLHLLIPPYVCIYPRPSLQFYRTASYSSGEMCRFSIFKTLSLFLLCFKVNLIDFIQTCICNINAPTVPIDWRFESPKVRP